MFDLLQNYPQYYQLHYYYGFTNTDWLILNELPAAKLQVYAEQESKSDTPSLCSTKI